MTEEALLAQIELAEERLEEFHSLKDWKSRIPSLDSYSPADKIEVFDLLYSRGMRYLTQWAEEGYEPKDATHYLYEALLSALFGRDIWCVVRAFQDIL